jgi:hypothetical protein
MIYDLEIVLPMTGRIPQRVMDFKKYGLVNIKDKKVLVNIVVSNNEKIKGITEGWPDGVDVRIIEGKQPNFVPNVYGFFADLEEDKFDSRWIMKMDDDSCTDVNGLVSNLDRFYDSNGLYYLVATLRRFESCHGSEHDVFATYNQILGDYCSVIPLLTHEIECCVVSNAAIKKILSTKVSKQLLEKRREVHGGATDVALAFAACLAKVYPIDCPFLTHEPLIHEFSLLKGIRNHIHLISRDEQGENFAGWERCSKEAFNLLLKVIEGENSEIEKQVMGGRYLFETEDSLKTYKFLEGNIVIVKFDHPFNWYENDGILFVLNKGETIHRLKQDEQGDLRECDFVLTRID